MRALHDSQQRRRACDLAKLLDSLTMTAVERDRTGEALDAYRALLDAQLRMLQAATIANLRDRIKFNKVKYNVDIICKFYSIAWSSGCINFSFLFARD